MIRFSIPHLVGTEVEYLLDVFQRGRLSGDGEYTKKCSAILGEYLDNPASVLLTHSGTGALEMAALLADIQPGDEVIMPSYTFPSTANAFVLRGGVPVFVDIRPDTLNIDERLIEAAVTPRTKAIVAVHYAGVACELDALAKIADRYSLLLIEDAAQALGSRYRGRKLGTIGSIAAFSFHETKNIVAGEGGALVINDQRFVERAEIIREKGTNRSRFFRGEVDKYTWVDVGSSYLPGELIAAFLYAQLQHIDSINASRMHWWKAYHAALTTLAADEILTVPAIPSECSHNAHAFCILTRNSSEQAELLAALKADGVGAVFHYIPLHSSEAGRKFGRVGSSMDTTNDVANRLIRLPLYPDLEESAFRHVCDSVIRAARQVSSRKETHHRAQGASPRT